MALVTVWPCQMMFRRKLRTRIIFSFLAFGLALSAMLGGTIWLMRQYLEDQLLGVSLMQELTTHMENLRSNPGQLEQRFTGARGWFVRPGVTRTLPDSFHELETGIHYLEDQGKPFMVVVNQSDDIWGYLQYDISWNKHVEHLTLSFILVAIIFFAFISLMLSIWSSRRIMRPVTDLVSRIELMSDHEEPKPLRPYFADDEVGQLAEAFDDYANRLTLLVRQDKEFNADVSHELRTPLAVIRSASELLLGQADLSDKSRTRLERIQRAVRQSTDLTTALLHLVREQKTDHNTAVFHQIVPLVEQVIEDQTPQLARKPVEINLQIIEAFQVNADSAAITVALGNLIGNAFKYTHEGMINITIEQQSVSVADTGPGLPEDEMDKVFDRYYRGQHTTGKGSGIGLAIVQRLCNLYGWQVTLKPGQTQGLVAKICFSNPSTNI